MPVIFDTLTKQEALARLRGQTAPAIGLDSSAPFALFDAAQVNRQLYDGQHWLDSAGWIGPIPATSDATYNDIKAEIARIFCSRNVVKEVVDRIVDALLKREPRRSHTRRAEVTEQNPLTTEQEQRLSEAHELALDFWQKRDNLKILKEVTGRRKLGESVCVRHYVPRGLLVVAPNGAVGFPKGTIADCLDKIFVHVTHPGQAAVVTDANTQRRYALYSEKQGNALSGQSEYVELVYTDGDKTILRVWDEREEQEGEGKSDQGNSDGQTFELQIGGRLTIYEPGVRSIISEQIRQNQFAINLAKTMQSRNVVTGGFLERVILDAMPPGRWIDDPANPGKQIYEVGPFKVGGGTTNFYVGAEYRDEQGNVTGHGSPSVHFRDPVSNATFIEAKRDCYQDILEEVGQPHVLISGDATASGRSREQAREIFEGALQDDKGELDPLVVWLLETPLALASYFAGQAGYFEECQAQGECLVESGPLSSEERTAIIAEWEKGAISTETMLSRLRVTDVPDELQRLQRARAAAARLQEIEAMQAADFSVQEIQRRAWDLSEEEINALSRERNGDGFTPPTKTEPPQGQ